MSVPDPTGEVPTKRRRKRRPGGWRARGPQLTERDLDILRWIARHGVVTAELVGRRFFWRPRVEQYGRWAAYRRLRALRQLGLVLSDKPFAHHPAVIRVSRAGAELAGVGLRPAPLVLHDLRHALALVELTEALLARYPRAELFTERELRAQRHRELRDGTRQTGQGRTPDALLCLPTPSADGSPATTVAVELDLSRKDRRAMEQMIHAYDHESVHRVWWFVPVARVERVAGVVRDLRADNRVEILPWHG